MTEERMPAEVATAALAGIDAAQKDAERYHKLRANVTSYHNSENSFAKEPQVIWDAYSGSDDDVDAAVDAMTVPAVKRREE